MFAKKSLGQNFLKSKEVINKIISVSLIQKGDIIIEIGPGKGALTEEILLKCRSEDAKLIAIEKDDRLIEFLKDKFVDYINKEFYIINQDILQINILDIIKQNINTKDTQISDQNLSISEIINNQNIKIIANIPYYITGAILKKFVDENIVKSMTLLVQKEVAERIVSRDNKESILSLSIKSYGISKYITKVAAKYFNPKPKVDSAVIFIQKYNNNIFINQKQKDLYFEIIKNGLQFKRKTLLNNLKSFIKENNIDEIVFKTILNNVDLKENVRGEDIIFEKWLSITQQIENLLTHKDTKL